MTYNIMMVYNDHGITEPEIFAFFAQAGRGRKCFQQIILPTSGFARSCGTPIVGVSPSAIAEANAAVNGVQQAKTKETKKREVDRAHCTCVRIRY